MSAATTADDRRLEIASSLLSVPAWRAKALDVIGPMLTDAALAAPFRTRLIAAVGEGGSPETDAALVAALARSRSQEIVDQLLRRPESSLALVAALKKGTITTASLGPAQIGRLRNHPNRQVAAEATAYFDALAPSTRAKDDLIASLLPEVEKAGDAAKGRELFVGVCSACHRFGDLGRSDAGPALTGMGAHSRAELLAHILDPNRAVDPSYWQWNVTTRRGESLAGVVAAENDTTLTLRHAAGTSEIRKDDIVSRENTRRSLMPEGLESMGAEGLRDLLTFLTRTSSTSATPMPSAAQGGQAAPAAGAQGPKEGGRGDAPLPETKPIVWAAGKTKVLIIGGGSSHDFGKFFGGADRVTLEAAGFSVNYTEDRDQAAAEIGNADVAVISVNRQFFDTPEYRKALFDFAAAGKGLVMLHPGTWYGYAQWPELNATIVGGGARGHDRIAKFSVNAVKRRSPGDEGRARVVRGRGRALLPQRRAWKDSSRHGRDRGAGRDVTERALQATAPGRLPHHASARADRRHHARPRRACARPPRVQDAAGKCRTMGGDSRPLKKLTARGRA